MHVNLSFYTDGACSSTNKGGGWSCLAVEKTDEGNENLLSVQTGHEELTTNNRMELRGFICALETINSLNTYEDAELSIYTDSAYIVNCINQKWYVNWRNNGWRTSDKREVKNQDLWCNIIALYIRASNQYRNLKIIKVKAHESNKWNNAADLYAVKARKEVK